MLIFMLLLSLLFIGAGALYFQDDIKQVMEVFVLLKGYDYEGFGSDVEVLGPREVLEKMKVFTETMNNFYN